jgi:galactokinase
MVDIHNKVIEGFNKRFESPPQYVVRAPGRVNLLGEHVDYNDGFVMPMAIEQATYIAFRQSRNNYSTLTALDLNQEISFTNKSVANKKDISGKSLPGWALYPAGIQFTLQKQGLAVPEIDTVFSSSVPSGSGLSSSASIEMGFCLAWKTLGKWEKEPMELAKLGQQAENTYVGVKCGIMDQFASLCGEENRVLYLDCRSLVWDSLELPQDVSVVIADTTIRHHLPSGIYNINREYCEQAVAKLNEYFPDIKTLRDISLEEFNRFAGNLPLEVSKKARFVVEEIERVQIARNLLISRNLKRFGKLMIACHNGLRDLYQVSCLELDILVDIAISLPGCYGARLTGAGFGGCTVNLVDKKQVKLFMGELACRYSVKTGLIPTIFQSDASNGAGLV